MNANEIAIPQGFQEVAAEMVVAELSASANRATNILFKDDVITVPDDAIVLKNEFEAGGVMRTAYYIVVEQNDAPRMLSFGTFRNFPTVDALSFAERTQLMRQLFCGNDYDRLTLLRGKKIKCLEVVDLDTRDFGASEKAGSEVLKKKRFAVLDYA